MIHLSQLGSTSAVDTVKLRDGELDQLLGTLTTEAATRSKTRREQIDSIKIEKIEFLSNCRNLIQAIIPGPIEADTNKPLEKAYQLLENVVSTLQAQLQLTKEDQKEETYILLRQQYTAFSEAHKVLQDHLVDSIITEEVLRNWPTYYGQVFQQSRQTREKIQEPKKRRGREETMRNTIQDHIVLETAKLQKLEKQAHQWVQQPLPSLDRLDIICLQMKRLLDTAEEKAQSMGPDMESITDLSIQEKMSTLSSITTLKPLIL